MYAYLQQTSNFSLRPFGRSKMTQYGMLIGSALFIGKLGQAYGSMVEGDHDHLLYLSKNRFSIRNGSKELEHNPWTESD